MYNCFDISKQFLEFAKEEGQHIDPMKLLKLTYIAHGYYMGFYDKPLIENAVQAWKFGPVIPELYFVIKRFKTSPVHRSVIDLYSFFDKLEDKESSFIKIVWDVYKKYTGLELSARTHEKGSPWEQTYKPNTPNLIISNELIKKYYKDLIQAAK